MSQIRATDPEAAREENSQGINSWEYFVSEYRPVVPLSYVPGMFVLMTVVLSPSILDITLDMLP